MKRRARQSRAAAEAVPEKRVALKVAGFQRHEAFAFGVAAVNDHGQGQLAGKVELGGKGLILNFPGAVVPVKVEADFPDGPETGLGVAGGADGVEGFGRAALPVAGMNAENEEHAGMGVEKAAAFEKDQRIKKDVADVRNARGGGALDDGVAVGVEFLAVKMGVAVHAAGGQRAGKRVDARRFLFGHDADS